MHFQITLPKHSFNRPVYTPFAQFAVAHAITGNKRIFLSFLLEKYLDIRKSACRNARNPLCLPENELIHLLEIKLIIFTTFQCKSPKSLESTIKSWEYRNSHTIRLHHEHAAEVWAVWLRKNDEIGRFAVSPCWPVAVWHRPAQISQLPFEFWIRLSSCFFFQFFKNLTCRIQTVQFQCADEPLRFEFDYKYLKKTIG